jgi:hypothetical protein
MNDREQSDPDFLRDLADRIMHIPVVHNLDQGDVDRLLEIARKLERNDAGN